MTILLGRWCWRLKSRLDRRFGTDGIEYCSYDAHVSELKAAVQSLATSTQRPPRDKFCWRADDESKLLKFYGSLRAAMKYDRVVCVGPGRSGSTYLYYRLSGVEPITFLHDKEKNALYKKNDARWRLDFSNTYIYRSDIVDRVADIATRTPSEDIGLVFLRRNTADRLNSLYRYQIQSGIIKRPDEFFQNIVEAPECFFVGKSATKLFDSSKALSNVAWIFISSRTYGIFGDRRYIR